MTDSLVCSISRFPSIFHFRRCFRALKKIERQNQDYKPVSSVAGFLTESSLVEKLTNEEAYKGAAGFRWSVYLWPYCNPQTYDFFVDRVNWSKTQS